MKLYCDPLRDYVHLPEHPRRIVSLASGLTEALVHMGHSDAIVGISEFCPRYVPSLQAPIVGDYLKVDAAALREVQPDLILLTTGIQRTLAYKLHQQGLPVYLLPLPNSLQGVLENVLTLGALVDDIPAARALVQTWNRLFLDLEADSPTPKPRIYAELWFGKHVRMTGGLTFVHDIIQTAGGENIFGDVRTGYLELDMKEVERRQPDLFLCFSEPEHPVQAVDLMRERGWDFPYIQADVQPEHNLIHDGPSMMKAAQWLHQQLVGRH
ncbi:MAG: ABC transporter substrate-binding protein [Chloroflexota bacterium]|nr:ABC transporter substrate-binding protein [Chloroflexota bacterium]MBI5705146.1 ABC transporter substrate-binding protein [Chloroflexota bacterium]